MAQRPPYTARCRQLLEQDMDRLVMSNSWDAELCGALAEYHDLKAIQRHLDPKDAYSLQQEARRISLGLKTEEKLVGVIDMSAPCLEDELMTAAAHLNDCQKYWDTVGHTLVEDDRDCERMYESFGVLSTQK